MYISIYRALTHRNAWMVGLIAVCTNILHDSLASLNPTPVVEMYCSQYLKLPVYCTQL